MERCGRGDVKAEKVRWKGKVQQGDMQWSLWFQEALKNNNNQGRTFKGRCSEGKTAKLRKELGQRENNANKPELLSFFPLQTE